jgi:TrmH family RNA methyltransferase
MTALQAQHISSRDNALLKELRRLAQDNTAYKKQGRLWIEGDHLCRAALLRGLQPVVAVFTESFWPIAPAALTRCAVKTVVIPDQFFRDISGLESPASMGFVLDTPTQSEISPTVATVILDRVQDAGNVGSILRSAGAFGFKQILAIKGTAALWSPKVLRAGMGAHFGLNLHEGVSLEQVDLLQVPILVTSSHEGIYLHEAFRQQALPGVCAWAMGHEGQGVCAELVRRAQVQVRIAQPGGEESLNVAAAAAICLQASASASL